MQIDLQAEAPGPVSLPAHLTVALERAIIERRLEPGQRVLETDLAELLEVSRTPIREALRSLERSGLVIRRHGRGTFIAPLLSSGEVLNLYRARVPVESFLAGRAAEVVDRSKLRQIERAHRAFEEALAQTGTLGEKLSDLRAADTELHMRVYEAADSVLLMTVKSYWPWVLREGYQLIYRDQADCLRFASEHGTLVDALRAGDAAAASDALERHLLDGIDTLEKNLA